MEAIGQYIFQVTAAAILCGLIRQIIGDKGSIGGVMNLVTALVILLTAISPLISVRIGSVQSNLEDFSFQSQQLVSQGTQDSENVLREIIIEKTRTYILDKARSFGADLTVEVMVEGSTLPTPCAVTIRGAISPYGKKRLQAIIRDDLGVPLEEQTWIS